MLRQRREGFELHWHPNDDEWQYYIKGTGRMTVFAAGGHARSMDKELLKVKTATAGERGIF